MLASGVQAHVIRTCFVSQAIADAVLVEVAQSGATEVAALWLCSRAD